MRKPDTIVSTQPTTWWPRAGLRALRIFAPTLAGLVPVVTVAMFILDPPSLEDIRWEPGRLVKARPFLCGQAGLIATWAALGGTPWYARWAVAALTFLLTTHTVQAADTVLCKWFYQPWEIHTVALLSFTLYCALRAAGMRVEAVGAPAGEMFTARQFSLRRLFVWVTCVAVLSLAWKHWLAVEYQRGLSWPADLPDCFPLTFATASSFTAASLVAILATLRRKPLRWWMVGLVPTVALFHTAVDHIAFDLTVPGGSSITWPLFVVMCRNDVLPHLGPFVCILLLVRAAGYRLTWSRRAE